MVVIFLHEEIVVLLDEQAFAPCQLRRLDLLQDLVIDLRSLINELELGLVAVAHPSVELSLQEEGDDKPVDGNHAVGGTLQEKED